MERSAESKRGVLPQFEKERLCARGRSLVPLEKTRDFGMTPDGGISD
jgi:hypothetical protein